MNKTDRSGNAKERVMQLTLRMVVGWTIFLCCILGLEFTTIVGNPSKIPANLEAAETTIQITEIPDYGVDGFIRGIVTGVDPATHRVAPYIQIEGAGWWTKPTFGAPTVPINADGTFEADVATGGLDNRATIFFAAVIPTGVTPPKAEGSGRIPAELDSIAISIDSVERYSRTLEFAGRTWGVKESPRGVGPGGNQFSNDPADVFVDEDDLHLTVNFRDGAWWATEVILLDRLGYGTYSFQTNSELDDLDINVTFGAFTWDPYGDDVSGASQHREIDFEDGRWGNASDPTNAQTVVQPFQVPGNLRRYTLPDLSGDPALTRFFTWQQDRIEFVVLRGHRSPSNFPANAVIDEHVYLHDPSKNNFVPTEGRESFRFNLWLIGAASEPANDESVVVIPPPPPVVIPPPPLPVLPQSPLSNISTRGLVQTGDNVQIGGFIIGGTGSKTVLIRARGPVLTDFGVPGVLNDPVLQLFSGQTVIAENDNWETTLPLCQNNGLNCGGAAEITATGLDPCVGNMTGCARESAILVTLDPGPYTAIVNGVGGGTGVGLVEVFEVGTSTSRLTNISTRGLVGTGDDVMIGGFIIGGTDPKTVLVRARGPVLTDFGVPGELADPFLQLFSGQTVIAQSDDWQATDSLCGPPAVSCGGETEIVATGLDPCVGNLTGCAQESAILVTLPPGPYTAIVSGVNGGTGVGLVEVFEVNGAPF